MKSKVIDVGEYRALVAWKGTSIVVAFRGTENLFKRDGFLNWINNFNFTLLNPANLRSEASTEYLAAGVAARYHQGFVNAVETIWPPLKEEIINIMREVADENAETSIYITGHSLGGAMAQLFAWRANRNFLPVKQIVAYASPKIGNCEVVNAMEREFRDKLFRLSRETDPVPMVPFGAVGYCNPTSEILMAYENLRKLVELEWSALEKYPQVSKVFDTSLFSSRWEEHLPNVYVSEFDASRS